MSKKAIIVIVVIIIIIFVFISLYSILLSSNKAKKEASCKVDSDGIIVPEGCSCGTCNLVSMSRKVAQKNDITRKKCDLSQCKSTDCNEVPSMAKCVSEKCEKVTIKVTPECTSDNDCVFADHYNGCCPTCLKDVVSKASLSQQITFLKKQCLGISCPEGSVCSPEPESKAICVDRKCKSSSVVK